MINFVNNGTDEAILKSMPIDGASEELIKAMSKQGLVQKEVQVKGKNGQVFMRKQWVKAGEAATSGGGKGKSQSTKDDKKSGSKLSSRQMIDEIEKLPGWEEDGLEMPDGTFYAVSHDFDDINAKDIFVKTTVDKMVDGDIDDGKEMSIKEVYNEVMGKKDSGKSAGNEKALDTLQSMSGWDYDGFSTGENDDDVYYAVDHDTDDINGKIFLKTTVGAMVDGDVDEGGQHMTAQEVLNEVKSKK